jgi:hypothetical protein
MELQSGQLAPTFTSPLGAISLTLVHKNLSEAYKIIYPYYHSSEAKVSVIALGTWWWGRSEQ